MGKGLDVTLVARVEEDGPLLVIPPRVVDEVPLLEHVVVGKVEVIHPLLEPLGLVRVLLRRLGTMLPDGKI